MSVTSWIHRNAAGGVALLLLAGTFLVARPSPTSAGTARDLAAGYRFTPLSVDIPGGHPQQSIRKVNRDYKHIAAWISSVGAAVAMDDLDGDGLSNDLCLTDVRIDQVVVTPTPGVREDRYASFVLDPAPLPMGEHMAPMGCQPGDFNEDGHRDLLVYWWGRTPVIYLAQPDNATLSAAAYRPVELVSHERGGPYTGPQWNTNSVTVADFDGDGHDDIYIGNYFPHGPVLDHTRSGGVTMNQSMSMALNGGTDHLFRWTGPGTFAEVDGVFEEPVSRGWTLAAAANDVDGDLLPELYVANDFGPDRLLHNRSTAGSIRFAPVTGVTSRGVVPKSKVLGHDSFKGMGVDFGDLDRDGMYDMYVGNITTSFGIQESNFAFVNTAGDHEEVRAHLSDGRAPWEDRSAPLNLAWSGWSWDVKIADFTNRGEQSIVQTAGFVKGTVNRWAQLQELATANDTLLRHPSWWPHFVQGDDIAGGQHLKFHVKGPDGRYTDLSGELGLDIPIPTRGIATGDADGDGRLDFAVARQWESPVFYRNESPDTGAHLSLRLTHADTGSGPGSSAVGAQVRITTPDGRTLVDRVDGGSGHSGKRSPEVNIGLGDVTEAVPVQLSWRDRAGQPRTHTLHLSPGRHSITVGATATLEATS
jgi:hypothetical protein